MTPRQARLSIAAFLFLTGSVAANALFLQSETPSQSWRAFASGETTVIVASADAGASRRGALTEGTRAQLPGAVGPGRAATRDAASEAGAKPAASPPPATAANAAAAPTKPATRKREISGPTSAIQRELTTRGYEPGPVDGIIGMKTRAAIMAYEHDHGLAMTGAPSEILLKGMLFGASRPSGGVTASRPRTAEARKIVQSVQGMLTQLGYATRMAPGELDTETRSAIRAFERDHGMTPTGRVSGRLIAQLNRIGSTRMTIAAEWN